MDDAPHLREQAAKCRRLAQAVSDRRTQQILRDMAGELDADAARIEREADEAPQPPAAGGSDEALHR